MSAAPRTPGDNAESGTGVKGLTAKTTASALARYAQARERLDRGVTGHLQRRILEVDLVSQAMILGALAFTALIPVLITVAALLPLGTSDGTSVAIAHRLGLSSDATYAVQQLFPTKAAVRGATTFAGAALTIVSAFSWPRALQRGYELAWGLPSLGWRSVWRPLVWLGTLLVIGGLAGASAPLTTGWVKTLLLVVLGLPVAIGWAWWTQHLLLGGRLGWRLALPGAVLIGTGLVVLRVFAGLYLSTSITYHFRVYGPLGIVFVLWTWFLALSVVLLGGGVVGAALHEWKRRRDVQQGSSAMGDADGQRGDVASPRDDSGWSGP
jgi:membrane protein